MSGRLQATLNHILQKTRLGSSKGQLCSTDTECFSCVIITLSFSYCLKRLVDSEKYGSYFVTLITEFWHPFQYCSQAVTISQLSYPRNYFRILPIPIIIMVVSGVSLCSLLTMCHFLQLMPHSFIIDWAFEKYHFAVMCFMARFIW